MDLRTDPIDDDPRFASMIAEAEKAAEEELAEIGIAFGMGYCHVFWLIKKQILRERFGIDWQTPAKFNPNTIFD